MGADITDSASRLSRLRKGAKVAGAGVGAVVLYLWDDVIFAAPIIAAARAAGTLPAFVMCGVVYFAVSTAVALLAVRAYDKAGPGQGRLTRWAARQLDAPGRSWAARLSRTGSWFGFAVASVVLGGIVTTLLVRHMGVRARLGTTAMASSALFAIGFVGMYSGLSRVLFGIGR